MSDEVTDTTLLLILYTIHELVDLEFNGDVIYLKLHLRINICYQVVNKLREAARKVFATKKELLIFAASLIDRDPETNLAC